MFRWRHSSHKREAASQLVERKGAAATRWYERIPLVRAGPHRSSVSAPLRQSVPQNTGVPPGGKRRRYSHLLAIAAEVGGEVVWLRLDDVLAKLERVRNLVEAALVLVLDVVLLRRRQRESVTCFLLPVDYVRFDPRKFCGELLDFRACDEERSHGQPGTD